MKYYCGKYKGVEYHRQRLCDVMTLPYKSYYWFIYKDDKPTGDHFRTLKQLKIWVDKNKTEFNLTPYS